MQAATPHAAQLAQAAALNIGTQVVLDKPRTLLLDFNALAVIEERTGQSFMEIFSNFRPSAKFLRTLLWAGLLHEDPELTEEAAGKLMNFGNFRAVVDAITDSWKKAADAVNEGGTQGGGQ